jgi:glycosyltransferase involved in cell wall biosynthesis
VEIVCPDALADSDRESIEGVSVRRFPYFYPYLGLGPDARRKLDLKGGNLVSPGLFLDLLRRAPLDLAHLHTGLRLGGLVRTACRLRGKPYVVSLHGGVHDTSPDEESAYTEPTRGTLEWGKALGWLVGSRRVLDDAAAVLVLGRREQAEVARRHPRTRVVYFPNGVDPDRFAEGDGASFRASLGLGPEHRVVLVSGRIDPQKNQILAVRVMAALAADHPELRLVLMGHVTNDAYAARVASEISQSGLDDRVLLVPGLDGSSGRLADAYHAADVLMLPSVHEPFGIVILEAWAAGRPVLASRVGGVVDLVRDGEDGRLADPADVASFAGPLREILGATDLGRSLGEAGRLRVLSEFTWDKATDRLEAIYEEALSAHPVRS